jgi:O-antigen ligase
MIQSNRDADLASRWLDQATFSFLLAGAVLVPLLFWPWAGDVFVGPKFDAIRLLTAIGAGLAGTWLVVARPRLRLRVPDVAAATFLVFNIVAYTFSVDHRTSLLGEPLQQAGLVSVFAFAGAYATARVSVRTPDRLAALLTAASLAGTVTAIYGLVQLGGVDPVWANLPKGRVFSSIGQPNWLAAYLILTIPLTFALAVTARHRSRRLLGIGATIIQMVVLVATLSRSGYLGLLVVIVVGGIVVGRQRRKGSQFPVRFVAVAAAATLIGGALLVGLSRATPAIAPADTARRAASALNFGAFDSQRYVGLWEVGVAIAVDHPLTGTGQDTYAIVFPEYRDSVLDEPLAEHFARFRPESPHNMYVAIAAGAGIPALAAYLVLIGSVLALILRQAGTQSRRAILATGIFAALLGHLVTDWFMTVDLSGSWLAWALMGAALASMATRLDIKPAKAEDNHQH